MVLLGCLAERVGPASTRKRGYPSWPFLARARVAAIETVCGPPTLLPSGNWVPMEGVEVSYNLDEVLPQADVVMPLRLQKERMQAGLLPSLREYARLYRAYEGEAPGERKAVAG